MIYISLFTMFFRIGLFSFGGGLAMLPLIFQSVQSFGIMSARSFADLVAVSQVTPGPIAVNAATFVGFNSAGILGAAVSTIGVCLPSFVIMLIVARFVERFYNNRYVQGAFLGMRPVTLGLVGATVFFVGEEVLVKGSLLTTQLFTGGTEYFNFVPIGIFAVTVLLVGLFKVKPIKVMIIMGIAGALLCG